MMRTIVRCLLSCLALGATGCSLVLDDRVGGFTHDEVPDLELTLMGFDPHVDERVEVLLVDDERLVAGHAVIDTMPAPQITVRLENAISDDIHRVNFWADNDRDGTLTPPFPEDPEMPENLEYPDHMWSEMLDELGRLEYTHSLRFADIVNGENAARFVGGPASIEITGAEAFDGETAEVLVINTTTDVQVGYYFQRAVTDGTIRAELGGVIDEETGYTIRILVGGETRCLAALGNAAGLTISVDSEELTDCQE